MTGTWKLQNWWQWLLVGRFVSNDGRSVRARRNLGELSWNGCKVRGGSAVVLSAARKASRAERCSEPLPAFHLRVAPVQSGPVHAYRELTVPHPAAGLPTKTAQFYARIRAFEYDQPPRFSGPLVVSERVHGDE
jgi:hypothetical protein